jgi:hypothetical protein
MPQKPVNPMTGFSHRLRWTEEHRLLLCPLTKRLLAPVLVEEGVTALAVTLAAMDVLLLTIAFQRHKQHTLHNRREIFHRHTPHPPTRHLRNPSPKEARSCLHARIVVQR